MSNKIFEQIPKVMADMDAIAKDSENKQQGFKFRGIDAVYNELHGHLAKHGVFTTTEVLEFVREERQTKTGSTMIYTVAKIKFKFYADDGSFVESTMIGEAADHGDKSANKAMAIAHKYAFLQIFSIPTEDQDEPKDPDFNAHEIASKAKLPNPVSGPIGAPAQVSDAQLKRLFAIANKNFWKEEDVRSWMSERYRIDSTRKLSKVQYEELCGYMESHGPPRLSGEWPEPGTFG